MSELTKPVATPAVAVERPVVEPIVEEPAAQVEDVEPEYQKYIRIPDVIEAKIADAEGTAHGHEGSVDYKAGDALVRYTLPDEKTTAQGTVYYEREYFRVISAADFAHYALLGKDGGLAGSVAEWDVERTAFQEEIDALKTAKKVSDDRVVALDWQVVELRRQLEEANSKLVAAGK